MACSDGLDLPLGVGVSDVGCDAGEGRIYTWSVEGGTGWAFGGLGSGSGVQFQGNWLKGKFFWLLPCFYTTALLSHQGTDLFFFCPRPKINT